MGLNKKVQAIIFRKGSEEIEFLMLKTNKQRGGFWQPVTGKVELDEDLLPAVKREVREEIGVSKHIQIIEDIYSFTYPIPERLKFKVSFREFEEHVYGIEINPEDMIRISGEHEEFRWLGFDEAYEMLEFETNKVALKKLNNLLIKKIKKYS